MLITDRLFQLTEKESKSIGFKEGLLHRIGDDNIIKALARSIYFDNYLNLFSKFMKSKLIDEETKDRNKKFVKYIIFKKEFSFLKFFSFLVFHVVIFE